MVARIRRKIKAKKPRAMTLGDWHNRLRGNRYQDSWGCHRRVKVGRGPSEVRRVWTRVKDHNRRMRKRVRLNH